MTDSTSSAAAFEPLSTYREYPPEQMAERSRAFAVEMHRRRSTRHFSNRPVPRAVIETCIETAGTAPSGAHIQPWHFVAVSDAAIKARIRAAAEKAEREFYGTAPAEWLGALARLGTDAHKPYLETAPYLIVVFAERHRIGADGQRHANYYVTESVGIATGFLLAALHNAGLVALTHTPSPMGFLSEILGRPKTERALMIVVTGYPAADASVPALRRKSLSEIATFV